VIREATLCNTISGEAVETWLGQSWADTASDVGNDNIRRMMEDARANGVSGFRQIVQRFPSGLELPVEYTTVRLGAGLMAIGKSLQAVTDLQTRLIADRAAIEQDYWKRRAAESKYRTLFDVSADSMMLLDPKTLRIVEVNPAAAAVFGRERGGGFDDLLAESDRVGFRSMLQRVREQGKAPGIIVHLGEGRQAWGARATIIDAETGIVVLLQLSAVGSLASGAERNDGFTLDHLIEFLPDGFVVLDRDGAIRRANRAFLDMVQAGAEGAVLGVDLGRWMRRPGADMQVFRAALNRNGAVRLFPSSVQGEWGAEVEIEVSAGGCSDGASVGVLLRDIGRRLPQDDGGKGTRTSIGLRAEPDYDIPLKQRVIDAVAGVEREYIELALARTGGNRTAAAELLGLSRQSLYSKLNRHARDGGS